MKKSLPKVYLATNFFSEAMFLYTDQIASEIREAVNVDLYVPQENADINDKSKNDVVITAKAIAEADSKHLYESNVLIACLDGVEIDAGVASEIGYFSALIDSEGRHSSLPKLRTIIGIYSDIRKDGTGDNRFYINLYTKGLVQTYGDIYNNAYEAIEALKHIVDDLNNHQEFGGTL